MIKHPKLMEICKERKIPLEVCPISFVFSTVRADGFGLTNLFFFSPETRSWYVDLVPVEFPLTVFLTGAHAPVALYHFDTHAPHRLDLEPRNPGLLVFRRPFGVREPRLVV